MPRRTISKLTVVSSVFMVLSGVFGCAHQLNSAQTQPAPSTAMPNIVYILADDLGYGDLSCLNPEGKIKTPNIDSLASAGMIFTDAHSGSAVCTPTRYGVMTGRYAWRTRLKSGVTRGFSRSLMAADRMTVASMLKENGYRTGCVGKWHLGWEWALTNEAAPVETWTMSPENVDFSKPITRGPLAMGFDYNFVVPASLDMAPYVYVENNRVTAMPDRTIPASGGKNFWRSGAIAPDFEHVDVLPTLTKKAVGFIDGQAGDEPFFLYFPLTAPHKPISPSADFQGQSGLNEWGDFVMQVDWTVGQVLDALKRNGLEKNTLIIMTSDNGATPGADFSFLEERGHDPSYVFRGHKADLFEGGHRIPFIAKWPGRIEPGSISDETICLTDLMATSADIVEYGLPGHAGEDSVSILPALLAKPFEKPLREATVHHSINGHFSIRKGKWKLLLSPGSGGWSAPRPGSPEAKASPPVQLYNLEEDIGETTNLQDAHPEIVEELTNLLQGYVDRGRSTPGARQSNEGKTPIHKT